MHVMLGELLDVVSVGTKAYAQRMLSVRAVDHRPNNGMRYAIGPPINISGISAGHKNTNNGYFLVTHTLSTPFSFRISISCVSFSTVGVHLGALVR